MSYLVRIMEYPTNLIDKLEVDDASLSNTYYYFGEMYDKFANNINLQEKVNSRLDFIITSATELAFILVPEYAVKGFYF